MDSKKKITHNESVTSFPPVVAVLGHVDHGKTTLLDAIRKSSIAQREIGGITQKIGASSIEIIHEGKKRTITFIDTPGHEAFSKMRGRGAQAADVALLIVSVTDGVMPQTRESIEILRETETPFIVVLTKIDLPTKNPDKVKHDLLKEQVMLEGYGGEVPVIEVSAKTNQNVKELLDLILLMYDFRKTPEYEKEITSDASFRAVVIESKMDKKTGPLATVVIKNGTVHLRDELLVDKQLFKVRALITTQNIQVQKATVGEAIEVLGFTTVPAVGSIVSSTANALPLVQNNLPATTKQLKRELIYKRDETKSGISAILVADTQGSLEAIMNALPKDVELLLYKTGEVTEADILLAKSTGSIVLSFNTKIRPEVQKLAITEKVLFRNYQIIYELLDEVQDALEGKKLAEMEQVFGKAKVLAKFPFEKTNVFGISVSDGRIARGDRVRILRGEILIGESSISSLRVGKNPTSKVEKGHEAGILLSPYLDIQVGDVIIPHS